MKALCQHLPKPQLVDRLNRQDRKLGTSIDMRIGTRRFAVFWAIILVVEQRLVYQHLKL
jgi:hypothetical protein